MQCGQDLLNAPLLDGLVEQLGREYPDASLSAVESALRDSLTQAAGAEKLSLGDIECNRDYRHACPRGVRSSP